jgi:hypothetical protein
MIKSVAPNMMTESIEETIKFYVENLGFQEYDSASDETGKKIFVILGKDNAVIMFQLKESLVAEYPVLQTDEIKPMLTLYFIVENFDEYYEQIKKTVVIMKEIHVTPYGAKEFAVLDNNKIALTFAQAQ